jgi:hypothetical protein
MIHWRHFGGKLANIIVQISTWPFAEPKMAVLYGTFAGIILVAGMNFVLGIFTDNGIRSWGLRQTAGSLFIMASVMTSLIAWSLQLFSDFLVERGKNKSSLQEKSVQFCDWNGRWFTRVALLLTLIMIVSAAVFLVREVGVQLQPPAGDCLGGGQIGR